MPAAKTDSRGEHKSSRASIKHDKPIETFMVVTGFFGYLFSMVCFSELWDDVRKGMVCMVCV